MTKFQKKTAVTSAILGVIGFSIWLYFERSFEPLIGLILIIGTLLGYFTFDSKYKKNRLKGRVTFDYSNNNGIYTIGNNDLTFETKWTKSSDQSIHLYNDQSNITGIAAAKGFFKISDVKDASQFDFSSRTRTIQKHGVAILKNVYGNFAAIKVVDIKDNSRNDDVDELTFEYVINPNGKSNFS